MKKAKKLLVGLALTGMLLTTGCNNSNKNAEPYRQQDVYQLYKAAGGKMTYQEWLATVRGADGSQIYCDAGEPAASAGQDGDIYINLENFYLYLKDAGVWKKLFSVQGPQGEQGPQGPQGEQGYQGIAGKDGSNIYADAGVPSNDAGKDGDVYINLENFDIYQKLEGEWKNFGNIAGRDGIDGINGKDGAAFYCDAGVPSNEAGKDGDVYINIENFDMYTKLDGAWVKFGNIKGEQGLPGEKGDQGVSFRGGWGAPADSVGNEEDSYIDYSSGTIYKKLLGHWVKETNFNAPLSWKENVAKMMDRYFGFQVPFADFDAQSTIFTLTFEGYYEYLTIYDTNNYNVMADYADKLIADGYSYSSYYDQYYKFGDLRTPWVDAFGYDAENKANYLRIEFSPVQDEYYYLQKETDYSPIAEWPAERIERAMGSAFASAVTGVEFEGYAFDSFAVENEGDEYDEYSMELLVIEGDYVDELRAQVAAAGFIWDEDEEEFFDDKHDAEVDITYSYGYTRCGFYGTYAKDWDENYFLDNGLSLLDAWPDELITTLFGKTFAGANLDGNWYGATGPGDYYGTQATLATVGDFADEIKANLVAAGFEYVARYDDYEIDYYNYVQVKTMRGCTIVSMTSEYEEPATAQDMADIMVEFFDYMYEIECEVPLFETAAGEYTWDTSYLSSDLFVCYVDNCTQEEYNAFLAALGQGGWDELSSTYYVAGEVSYAYGSDGTVAAMDLFYNANSGYAGILCYPRYVMGTLTPESVIVNIAKTVGITDVDEWVEKIDEDDYAIELPYTVDPDDEDPITPEMVKAFCDNYFTPDGFEVYEDWYEDEYGTSGLPCEIKIYYEENTGLVLEYTVLPWTSSSTGNSYVSVIARCYYAD